MAQVPAVQQSVQTSPTQQNKQIRELVLRTAVQMIQQLNGGQLNSNVFSIVPRNVGLTKKFIINITGTATPSGGNSEAQLSDLGLANLILQAQFIDLQNYTRVQCPGWQLEFVERTKKRWSSAAILNTSAQQMANYGATYPPVIPTNQPGSTFDAATAFSATFELPLAYSDNDLTGAINMNVTDAQAQLNVTLIPSGSVFAAYGDDSTNAVFTAPSGGATAVALSNIVVTVYQVFLDQLPKTKAGLPLLPPIDISTIYELKNSTLTGIVENQDFPIPYANFREFLSTMLIYNNGAGDSGARESGGDISYLALQVANFANINKYAPLIPAKYTRDRIFQDFPPGCYYFPSRQRRLSTAQWGNIQLILNALTATTADAYVYVGWESFASQNTLINAGSLAAS